MANFRCERLFLMLDEPVPGLNPMKAVDPVAFAWHDSDLDAERLDLTPLGDFSFAPFEQKRWRPASAGLKTVRGLLQYYRGRIGAEPGLSEGAAAVLAKKVAVLEQVEAVLDAADSRDRRFYLAAKDLG